MWALTEISTALMIDFASDKSKQRDVNMISISWASPESREQEPTPEAYLAANPVEAIILQVAHKYEITPMLLKSARRARHIAWPRQEVMWRASRETGTSLPKIGQILGNRDHTTVMHGIKAYERRMAAKAGA